MWTPRKRDLQSDGTLQPSAESSEPEKIVEAFTTLSMNGPLREAYEQNRVRIHALDLLSAAASVLGTKEAGTNAVRDSRQRFDTFMDDLTDYLNSGEYTVEFVRDSLRQARGLCGELRELATAGEIRRLRDRQDALSLEMRIIEHRLASVDRLGRIDWPSVFEKMRAEATERAGLRLESTITAACAETHAALDAWYETDESLRELEEQRWDPVLVHAGLAMAQDVRACLADAARGPFGGAQPSAEAVDDFHRIGVNLGGIASAAMNNLGPLEPLEAYLINLALDEIPVAKTVSDWLLFRRAATIRRRVFGEEMESRVEPAVKLQRLPAGSRETLRGMIEENIHLKFTSFAPAEAAKAVYGYVEGFCGGLQGILQHKREQFISVRDALRKEAEANQGIVALMQKVEGEVSAADTVLAALSGAEIVTAPRAEEPVFAPELVEAGPRHYSAA